MELMPGYKHSDVGVIPEDWNVRSLGEIATIKDGTHQTPKYQASGVPFYSVEHVTSGDFENTKFISEQEHQFLTRSFRIEKGDILMTRIGSIGECKLIDWDVRASFYVSLALLKIKDASAEYIAQYSNSSAFKREIELHSLQHATPKKINLGPISDVKIALPQTETEQRAIARALSDVDALLATLDQVIAKKRDLKQAAMQQLLTGKARLPGFSGEWEVKRLDELASLYQPQTISAQLFTEAGFPVYGANGVVGFYHSGNHETWQVTVTCRGSTCGTVNRTVDECWITGNAMVLNCDSNRKLNKDFFYYLMLAQDMSDCITGTGQPQIVRAPLSAFKVRLPMDSEEQAAIAEILSDMNAELSVLEASREKNRNIKQAMMQELLTGKTRLV